MARHQGFSLATEVSDKGVLSLPKSLLS